MGGRDGGMEGGRKREEKEYYTPTNLRHETWIRSHNARSL